MMLPTLYVDKTPRENGGPLEIIICEAFPPAKQANREIGEHGQARPYGPLTVVRLIVQCRQQPYPYMDTRNLYTR